MVILYRYISYFKIIIIIPTDEIIFFKMVKTTNQISLPV